MADVGDTITMRLTVDPSDASTAATAELVEYPAGVTPPTLTPTASDAPTNSDWTVPLELTAIGAWRIKWTVTGTGNGVEYDTVYAVDLVGDAYATLSEYAGWLGAEPPAGTRRQLVQASRMLDALLIGARYPVDTDGLPTETVHIAALRDACCAQVEWWAATGDTSGTGAARSWSDVAIGSVRLSGGATSGAGSSIQLAPAAENALRVAGMLPVFPWVYG